MTNKINLISLSLISLTFSLSISTYSKDLPSLAVKLQPGESLKSLPPGTKVQKLFENTYVLRNQNLTALEKSF